MAKFSKSIYQMTSGAIAQQISVWRYVQKLADQDDPDSMKGIEAVQALEMLAEKFADTFSIDNRAFNRDHFLAVVRGERPVDSKPEVKRPITDCTCPFREVDDDEPCPVHPDAPVQN